MALTSRRRLAPRRPRNEDEGEDEPSVIGDIDDDSVSEPSALSDEVDGEASDEDGHHVLKTAKSREDGVKSTTSPLLSSPIPEGAKSAPTSSASVDTVAKINGLKIPQRAKDTPELQYEESTHRPGGPDGNNISAQKAVPVAPTNESEAQRSRREHAEYIKQRDSNPAFVPNRGGFFLHDDRSAGLSTWNRSLARGRGRGFNGVISNSRARPFLEPLEKQWAHDLHEIHEPTSQSRNVTQNESAKFRPALPPRDTVPNREFSFSNVLGNVIVNVAFPGVGEHKKGTGLIKKQYVLLPVHRPPLRRDKPVRISIPEVEPSYRFPSTERSFIFIPRAMRPNQQPYMRGRGRGSFHGSRRPSVFGGSAYTPSVDMSRRSSFGGARDTRSPAGSAYGRTPISGMEPPRPVVRMPAGTAMSVSMQPPMAAIPGDELQQFQASFANGLAAHSVHSTAIPMHHPKPQKALSLSNIESPTSLAVKAPQQQQQQPFHQQVPAYVAHPPSESLAQQITGQSAVPGGTPLSHIPEGAVYAQPFQPYPMMAPSMYYPGSYSNGTIYYPAIPDPLQNFGTNWGDGSYQNSSLSQRQLANSSAHFVGNQIAPTMNGHNSMMFYSDSSVAQPGQGQFVGGGQPGMIPVAMGGYGFYPGASSYYQTQP